MNVGINSAFEGMRGHFGRNETQRGTVEGAPQAQTKMESHLGRRPAASPTTSTTCSQLSAGQAIAFSTDCSPKEPLYRSVSDSQKSDRAGFPHPPDARLQAECKCLKPQGFDLTNYRRHGQAPPPSGSRRHRIRCARRVPGRIQSRPAMLEQVSLNLTVNAATPCSRRQAHAKSKTSS